MQIEYVRRCKTSIEKGNEMFVTLHGATVNETLCGKELNGMWFMESSSGLEPEDITCRGCRKVLRENVSRES